MNDLLNNTVYFKKKPMYDRSIYCDKILTQFAYAIGFPQEKKYELMTLLDIMDQDQVMNIYDQVVGDD